MISSKTIDLIKYNLKKKLFNNIKADVISKINTNFINSLKTEKGATQVKERLSIDFIKSILDSLKYTYKIAGSQQSKDFQDINKIGLNIEVKKTDSLTVYFNDTMPSSDIFYIIMFTGKQYKTKEDIPPKIIFINGYDLIKDDIYFLLDYKKDIENMKNNWARKKKNQKANKLKYFSVNPRPTYKIDISHLIISSYAY